MDERHPDGFLKHPREAIGKRDPAERRGDYREIYAPSWEEAHLRRQGERCMDCGVPTCHGGCPIGNLIPEWNDLVYRGQWREALERLHATNNFPEFTGYTCPAPCEPACTLAYNADAVAIKSLERAIVDKGWEMDWIRPEPPRHRTGKQVAVVGSGPAGLACAQQLNRAGHTVTVYERDESLGGLMTLGIPDFKFDKRQVTRRLDQLRREGIVFQTKVEVGVTVSLAELRERADAVCLAIGAQAHRDVSVPGRELAGIHFGMTYLTDENRRQAGGGPVSIDAGGKRVVVLGGGDTGADCVATAHRQGAVDVAQISVRDQPPATRPEDNPWPWQPSIFEQTYALEEGGQALYALDVTAFVDEDGDGRVDALMAERVKWTLDTQGRRIDKTVLEHDVRVAADLVLIAIGFGGAQAQALAQQGITLTDSGRVAADESMMTSLEGVFTTGDSRRGPSLVVWAIGEGRDAAHHIDGYLMGESRLPPSLATQSPPTDD
ncbi:glutamate synthase subunit beta [Aidingimonas halophila]|uniref:Glutamate synthase (NADPH/NADH) small chain n=1 Tax=Aidingimonas halophila TaxID=574349 RepID=A0A1H3DCQ6_9GAMM|nr:glutamate synthase subunit beta [Aidingimonas halophila]GHC30115.1 dihydropyrimidine dehydrogenase subunit A [Aidingimonas halophila]SDX64302.1 glutamate synthase (NADPH/NADH) small chain [Aidingimonas halophila]